MNKNKPGNNESQDERRHVGDLEHNKDRYAQKKSMPHPTRDNNNAKKK